METLNPNARPFCPAGGAPPPPPATASSSSAMARHGNADNYQQPSSSGLLPPPSSSANDGGVNNNTTAKLFVGQLPFECTEHQLGTIFGAYGCVEQIHILRNGDGQSKGAAFVTFANVQEADTAIYSLHNRYRMLSNRAIQVSYAKNSPNISVFGTHNAMEVHRGNASNPLPDIAGGGGGGGGSLF